MTATTTPEHASATTSTADERLLVQFDNLDQQHDASMLGMWTFLATEVLFFGGLIMAYVVYRTIYRDTFAAAAQHLNVWMGGINTVVLLTSSLTMALAVRAAQLKQRKNSVYFLVATMVFGTGFLVIKGFEYYAEYKENLIPFINFVWEEHEDDAHAVDSAEVEAEAEAVAAGVSSEGGTAGAEARPHPVPASGDWLDPELKRPRSFADSTLDRPPVGEPQIGAAQKAKLFFVLYFFMTGLHAIHMIIGLALVGIIAALAWRGWFSGFGETQIEVTGLYWHFIDIVWVFLYPLLYLIDLHK